jgi:putative sigma-54 modulation protein
MRLELTARHAEVTPALKRLVDKKLSRLERLLDHRALSAQAVLTREKNRCRVEITLHARGEKFLHGAGIAASWQPAVTDAIDKIAQQAERVKGKWDGRKRRGRRAGLAIDEPEAVAVVPVAAPSGPPPVRTRMPPIMRTERLAIRPMSLADAARAAEATDGLIVFRDTERDMISVLYRRNGELTLVETEA